MILWLVFFTLLGACVGSFLNVVVYRLPAGMSVVRPPSSCPQCGHRLAWYDNVPVLGWLWLRGRCRYCRAAISPQYPLIEALTAALFGGWFYLCYMTYLRPGFAGPGFEATWPIFLAYLALLAVLLGSTLIDARHYIIPLRLPYTAAAVALVLMPAAVLLNPDRAVVQLPLAQTDLWGEPLTRAKRLDKLREVYREAAEVRAAVDRHQPGPVEITAAPITSSRGAFVALGGAAGLGLAIVLLWRRILPYSFEQIATHSGEGGRDVPTIHTTTDPPHSFDPHQWLEHPHPRREVLKECLFLALPLAGALLGGLLAPQTDLHMALRVLGGVVMGYLVGGIVVWAVRIFGTLGFGKEAMGLGDVHLMAGVGAVAGWQVAVLAFFIAPFFGLAWALLSLGLAKLWRRQVRMIPYGPHLAVGTVVACIAREPLVAYLGRLGLV